MPGLGPGIHALTVAREGPTPPPSSPPRHARPWAGHPRFDSPAPGCRWSRTRMQGPAPPWRKVRNISLRPCAVPHIVDGITLLTYGSGVKRRVFMAATVSDIPGTGYGNHFADALVSGKTWSGTVTFYGVGLPTTRRPTTAVSPKGSTPSRIGPMARSPLSGSQSARYSRCLRVKFVRPDRRGGEPRLVEGRSRSRVRSS